MTELMTNSLREVLRALMKRILLLCAVLNRFQFSSVQEKNGSTEPFHLGGTPIG